MVLFGKVVGSLGSRAFLEEVDLSQLGWSLERLYFLFTLCFLTADSG